MQFNSVQAWNTAVYLQASLLFFSDPEGAL